MGNQILIIGFEKEENILYPHLQSFITCLSSEYVVIYKYFYERGYFLKGDVDINNLMIEFKNRFIGLNEEFLSIIAIDNLTYSLASSVYDNVILWSHDFVTNDQEHFDTSIQSEIRLLTKHYLANTKKIIIQDRDRLNLFMQIHEVEDLQLDIFYLPVSLHQNIVSHTVESLNLRTPKLLQIGGINQFRSSSKDLIMHYQKNSNRYKLYLHGFIDRDIQQLINTVDIKPLTTNAILNSAEVYKIVEDCDIGIICYNVSNKNFYLTAFASGQLVEFLKCSKPVIVFGHTNLKEYVSIHKIGVGIESFNELNDAIFKIVNNYELFSDNALSLFNECYNINIYKKQLIQWIDKNDRNS